MLVKAGMGKQRGPKTTMLMDNLEDDSFTNFTNNMKTDVKAFNIYKAKVESIENANYYSELELRKQSAYPNNPTLGNQRQGFWALALLDVAPPNQLQGDLFQSCVPHT